MPANSMQAHRRLRRKVVEPEDARPIAKTTALASEKNRAEQNDLQYDTFHVTLLLALNA
jgi:hypothetical protein